MSTVPLPNQGAVLQDASSRANQLPTLPQLGAKPSTTVSASATGASSRKRKSETSLEDDVSAYKQDLDHIDTEGMNVDLTCNQVRSRINKLLDSGIMKKGELCKAIGSNNNSVNTFLSKKGSMDGAGSHVYVNAWDWFKKREMAGLKMPDVKKRQKTGETALGSKTSKKAAAPGLSATDISAIHLPGEESDSVPVYDTCDEIRRKINAHLQTPGLTQAQFCRDLFAQLHAPSCKPFQSKTLSDFRGKKGPRAGATTALFYAAYVYFEKKRVAEGKSKSQHRLEMERIWTKEGGFDRENDGRHGYWARAGEAVRENKYGEVIIY